MLEELRKHREMVQGRIQKSFESGLDLNILKAEETEIFKAQETEEQEASVTDLIKAGVLEYDDSIEKAVYADTPQNRKLGRVGQEYHRGKGKKKEEAKSRKTSKVGDYSELRENGNHKYIYAHHGHGELKKKDFVNDVKKYLKSIGEEFDASKVKVKKERGYDHYLHNSYVYEFSGNHEEEEKLHSKKVEDEYNTEVKKFEDWKKKNKTASEILQAKFGSKVNVYDMIEEHITEEEKKEKQNTEGILDWEKLKAKIAKRIVEESK